MSISSTSEKPRDRHFDFAIRWSIFAVAVALATVGCNTDPPPDGPDGTDGDASRDAARDTTDPGDAGDTSGPEDTGGDTGTSDTTDDTGAAEDTTGGDTGPADSGATDATGEDGGGTDADAGGSDADVEGTDTTDAGDADAGGSDADGGGDACVPQKSTDQLCNEASVECGNTTVSSSCGMTEVDCGGCTKYSNSTCNNNSCSCTPKTCRQVTGNCGVFSDGCGGTVSCTSGCSDTLATGGYHTCFLDRSANEVRCWGWNKYGQLGKGSASTNTYNTPQVVSSTFNSPTSLTAGEDMTCLVDQGDAKCWGANYHGQALGYQQNMSGNTIKKVLSPKSPKVPGVGIRQIEAQVQHTCAITSSEEVYCWGHNWPVANGILVNSKTKTAVKPTQYTFGGTKTAITVDTGALHTCAESTTGELWCFGTDHFGAIGDGGTMDLSYHSPKKVSGFGQGFRQVESGGMDTNKGGGSASFFHDFSCAIELSGAAKCWGSDADGELGNDNTKNTNSGNSAEPAPVQVKGLSSDVSDLALGGSHACAIQTGTVYCWGGNNYGQIGDGTTTNRSTPVKISLPNNGYAEQVEAGYFHTCVHLRSGKVACWGRNKEGQLGDGSYTQRTSPVVITP